MKHAELAQLLQDLALPQGSENEVQELILDGRRGMWLTQANDPYGTLYSEEHHYYMAPSCKQLKLILQALLNNKSVTKLVMCNFLYRPFAVFDDEVAVLLGRLLEAHTGLKMVTIDQCNLKDHRKAAILSGMLKSQQITKAFVGCVDRRGWDTESIWTFNENMLAMLARNPNITYLDLYIPRDKIDTYTNQKKVELLCLRNRILQALLSRDNVDDVDIAKLLGQPAHYQFLLDSFGELPKEIEPGSKFAECCETLQSIVLAFKNVNCQHFVDQPAGAITKAKKVIIEAYRGCYCLGQWRRRDPEHFFMNNQIPSIVGVLEQIKNQHHLNAGEKDDPNMPTIFHSVLKIVESEIIPGPELKRVMEKPAAGS